VRGKTGKMLMRNKFNDSDVMHVQKKNNERVERCEERKSGEDVGLTHTTPRGRMERIAAYVHRL